MAFINGNKTYIVAAGVLLVGLGQFLSGQIDLMGLVNYMLAGAGAAALRNALPKKS